ncbi:inositol monophosphatase family protein [Carnobacterium pleistocenium]|uniref:inositol monophosphatase family protein n=1 Tax=Carnobacterium pleistocenium TaxID=181073 RepID=UPI00054D8EBA|nr:inositol monophosphatase family protein [Carnobacterium pleistocenium]
MNQVIERDQLIKKWIYAAAAIIKESFNDKLDIERKSNRNDLVTNMDKTIEKQFIEKIHQFFPGEHILGEEGFGDDINHLDGVVWIIDPIDGTLNFIKQQSDFAIMIAIYENGKGQLGYIYDVMQDKLYSAQVGKGAYCNDVLLPIIEDKPLKEGLVAISSALMSKEEGLARTVGRASSGVRLIGSAGIETAHVASGRLIGYLAAYLAPWDIAAGKVIAEEVGLVYTKLNGEKIDLLQKNPTLVAPPTAHKEISALLKTGKK